GWAKPRVAVMDFENRSPYGGYSLGRGASDILSTELVKAGVFRMMEREQIHSVLQEQNMGASGRIDPATAARIGKIIGVEYIITGAITEYGESKAGGGGGGINIGKKGYHGTVDIRVVDATTGEIVFADSGNHSVSRTSVRVFGFGGGENYNKKTATEVLRTAIQKLSAKIVSSSMIKESKNRQATAIAAKKILIADVDGNLLSFNAGSEIGLKTGDNVSIFRQGKVIKDPATGKILKIKYKKVGSARMTEVLSGYSEAEILSGSGFKVGDEVRK
ncbi:MAG: CsgG/HfaB family protein, partial [Thermodesulfobacteriota bacterium]|nr:CsgG/HfaB family protein [Thermodesulfobacteriota bacterium]